MIIRDEVCYLGTTLLIFGLFSCMMMFVCFFLPVLIPAVIHRDYDLLLQALGVLSNGYWVMPGLGVGFIVGSQLPRSMLAFVIFASLWMWACWASRVWIVDQESL